MIQDKDIRVTMRDGVNIALRIYRPDSGGPFPALFACSPYRYDNDELLPHSIFWWQGTGPIGWYVNQGYAYVHADVRGSGFSEGVYSFLDRAEQQDLYELIEWTGAQRWCTGKVGGIGRGYYGMSQWFMGIENPPHLSCLGIYDGLNDPYRYMGYPGGIEGSFLSNWFNEILRVSNLYPANAHHPRQITRDILLEVENHPLYDTYWKDRSAVERLDQVTVPLFSVGSWASNDLHLDGIIRGFLMARGPKKLMITGAATAADAARDFADATFHEKYFLPFYDMYLKGLKTRHALRPNVEYVLRHSRVSRQFEAWPPLGAEPMSFYLGGNPSTSTTVNDGGSLMDRALDNGGATSYSYPDPSWIGSVMTDAPGMTGAMRGIPTFISLPLANELEVSGGGKVVLYAASTRDDMDFIVRLSEQPASSSGSAVMEAQPNHMVVTKGWLRASHSTQRDPRRGARLCPWYTHAREIKLTAGKIYMIEVPLEPTAHIFKIGSRIRLEIAPADLTMTDGRQSHIYRPDTIGTDTVHHNTSFPSAIMLPILRR